MSELIHIRADQIAARRKLLATVSALVLTSYIASTAVADAETGDHPAVWIVLGGQLEAMQGTSSPFTAPFMTPDAVPDVYGAQTFAWKQKAPRFAFGGEGEIVFQPDGSDWLFSAAIRFGRANSKKHTHYQGPQVFHTFTTGSPVNKYGAAFSDTLVSHNESHAVIDFSAGKDVGIGAFGRNGASSISAGVRFAQFSARSKAEIYARPDANLVAPSSFYNFLTFHQYALVGDAERNFRGVGPSISWNASAALLGNKDDGEVSLDWGINGALLFGRQSAKLDHETSAYHFLGSRPRRVGRNVPLYDYSHSTSRSRSVAVPNLGGFAGLTMRKANAKVSLGYRADFFFGAVDTGIDARRTSDLGFHGPFATISIGLGG